MTAQNGAFYNGFTHESTYGQPTQTSGSSQSVFGFTGEETDGTGLVNLRARSYDATLGMFPSLDPLEGDTGSPTSLNRYAYVQGNPINMIDPTGTTGCTKDPTCPSGTSRTFSYSRENAAQAAFNLALNAKHVSGDVLNSVSRAYGSKVVLEPENSAIFMSLALSAGGFPMVTGPNSETALDTEGSKIGGWRATCASGKISGNRVWNNHNYASKAPYSDNDLIGYIYGTVSSGGDRIRGREPSPFYVVTPVDWIIKSTNGVKQVDPIGLSSLMQWLPFTADKGDYVFIDSSPFTHGFMIVGKGPAVQCDSKGLDNPQWSSGSINVTAQPQDYIQVNGNKIDVPYVADWGRQRNTARPFYCSNMIDPKLGDFFTHSHWTFLKVPDITVVPCDLYYPRDFCVSSTGDITCGQK